MLLDGAQGLGAVPVDVRALGCDFYAASGQKWLCGPNGTGYLYVRAERSCRAAARRGPATTRWRTRARARAGAAARRAPASTSASPPPHTWRGRTPRSTCSRGRLRARCTSAASTAPRRLAGCCASAAQRVAPAATRRSSPSRSGTREAFAERVAAEGIVMRDLPGRRYVRASVGAWTTEERARAARRAGGALVAHEDHDARTRSRRRPRANPARPARA